ncbi:MAG: hypothetical protein HY720_02255 [Planctomycetes bacterium]|nr:hypothetical protein [Planctomycetota bacterium]
MRGNGDKSGETPDRTPGGRFRPGNGVSRNRDPASRGGRPPRAVEAVYLRAITESVSEADWKAATLALLARAKEGDARCFELLARYLAPAESRTRVAVEAAVGDRRATLEEILAEYGALLAAPDAGTVPP